MTGVEVLEILESTPSWWIIGFKILCCGCMVLSSIGTILFACVFFDGTSEFLAHEIAVLISLILVGLFFFASAIWVWNTTPSIGSSYPREVVKVDGPVDINEFYQNYKILEYNEDDGTFTVQEIN